MIVEAVDVVELAWVVAWVVVLAPAVVVLIAWFVERHTMRVPSCCWPGDAKL
jgi:hypothetical protein